MDITHINRDAPDAAMTVEARFVRIRDEEAEYSVDVEGGFPAGQGPQAEVQARHPIRGMQDDVIRYERSVAPSNWSC